MHHLRLPPHRPKKRKKKKERQHPPDLLIVNIMQPVFSSKDDNLLIISSTTEFSTFELDFTAYTNLKEEEDDSSIEDETMPDTYHVYKQHIITQFRNAMARALIDDTAAFQQYDGKLGKRVSKILTYFLL